MLQQTQVHTVIPYYQRWMQKFPNISALSSASQQAVLKLWEGLGYYSRARNLHQAAQLLHYQYQGCIPKDMQQLQNLPGIGAYTAAAILSIGYNLPFPAIDTNAKRVLGRLLALPSSPLTNPGKQDLQQLAQTLLQFAIPRQLNQAIMELGARICRPQPLCCQCPLQVHCRAAATSQPHVFPPKKAKPIPKPIYAVLYLVSNSSISQKTTSNHQWLLRQRPQNGLWAGLWEFPWLEVSLLSMGHHYDRRHIPDLLQPLGIKPLQAPVNLGQLSHALTHRRFYLSCCFIHSCSSPSLLSYPWQWYTTDQLQQLPLSRMAHKAFQLISKQLLPSLKHV